PQTKAEVGLLYLSYRVSSHKQESFKKYNLTLQQFNILRILRGQYPKPANISLLRDRMLDKMSDASRLVDRLHKSGLVTKQTNDMDKRNADVLISEKALALLVEIDQDEKEKPSYFDVLSTHELSAFNEIVDKVLGNFLEH
ncbi:MAG TPA: MarR family transcriptional regulator, partial [Chitinophagaceae bacterium]|nr:MarR family transcriptional regulator [Chitinophagaceae bacterium]